MARVRVILSMHFLCVCDGVQSLVQSSCPRTMNVIPERSTPAKPRQPIHLTHKTIFSPARWYLYHRRAEDNRAEVENVAGRRGRSRTRCTPRPRYSGAHAHALGAQRLEGLDLGLHRPAAYEMHGREERQVVRAAYA